MFLSYSEIEEREREKEGREMERKKEKGLERGKKVDTTVTCLGGK